MKLLVFSASNSKNSINRKFALWAAQQFQPSQLIELDIHDYELPVYSPEREAMMATPKEVANLLETFREADYIVISFAEHNGNFTAAWKNVSDWLSRTERKFFDNKPVLALATSPGKGGAKTVLQLAKQQVDFAGGRLVGDISLPEFYHFYDDSNRTVSHTGVNNALRQIVGSNHSKVTN